MVWWGLHRASRPLETTLVKCYCQHGLTISDFGVIPFWLGTYDNSVEVCEIYPILQNGEQGPPTLLGISPASLAPRGDPPMLRHSRIYLSIYLSIYIYKCISSTGVILSLGPSTSGRASNYAD